MKKLLLFLMLGILVLSCKKEVTVPNSGIYRGTFFKIGPSNDTIVQSITWLALNENTLTFNVTTDTTVNAPAEHGGEYLVDNVSSMTFINNTVLTPQFQPDYYLDTIYNYTFDDKNFRFWQTIGDFYYEYDLVRW